MSNTDCLEASTQSNFLFLLAQKLAVLHLTQSCDRLNGHKAVGHFRPCCEVCPGSHCTLNAAEGGGSLKLFSSHYLLSQHTELDQFITNNSLKDTDKECDDGQ